MKRRQFLTMSAVALGLGALKVPAADKKPGITDADVLKEGQPTTIANYCDPKKKPNKLCPPEVKGLCSECMFYNQDKSETTHKGKKVAKCTLLQTKPQYVWAEFSCATFVKKV